MKHNVLFLCTGNSCRSQMAEGLLRNLASDRFEVYSAGTHPAERVHPQAVNVMAEEGIDISGQQPTPVQKYMGRLQFTHMMIVCDGANEECPRIFPGVLHRHFWPFDDPAKLTGSEAEVLAGFRRVRDEIREKIENWLAEMTS
ncbi:MAG TPA: arsenate reductase ArsC [Pirellulaceae bacterium]|nr:arsenate reductase ArsC [Pirellulaceae bacterium]